MVMINHPATQLPREFPDRLFPKPETLLADEIAALRQQIRELLAELKPVPSLILTGQEVINEMRRLER